jgi:hypothetical protein
LIGIYFDILKEEIIFCLFHVESPYANLPDKPAGGQARTVVWEVGLALCV